MPVGSGAVWGTGGMGARAALYRATEHNPRTANVLQNVPDDPEHVCHERTTHTLDTPNLTEEPTPVAGMFFPVAGLLFN